MRRIHDAHYPLIPDNNVVAYWTCNESGASSVSTITDYSGRTNHLICLTVAGMGTSTWIFKPSPFLDSTVTIGYGAVGHAAGCNGWLRAAPSAATYAPILATSCFSLVGWFGTHSSGSTRCYIEFAADNALASSYEQMLIGIYRTQNDTLSYSYDISTSTRYERDTLYRLPSGNNHIGLIVDVQPGCTGYQRKITTVVNGRSVFVDEGAPILSGTTPGASCSFTLYASRRFATNPNTPALVANMYNVLDDVALFDRAVAPEKVSEIYRNGVRAWNERRLLESNNQVSKARVFVADGDGTMINLSAYYGVDFVRSARIKDSVDDQQKTAQIDLLRYRGERLNLSPLDEEAVNNLGALGAGSYEPLIEYRRRIRIEAAVVPPDTPVLEHHYEIAFDGYIDSVSWGDERVSIRAGDRLIPLVDQYQLNPRFYELNTSAENHLQTIVNNNVPKVIVSGTTLVFGYSGGTPTIYTPASSGWNLRWDESPSGEVATLLQGIADQIGWRCRYRWDGDRQEERLTFERPRRDKVYGVSSVQRKNVDGALGVAVKTSVPHDFSVEQLLTLTGTVTNNFTDSRVAKVISNREVLVEYYPGDLGGVETNIGSLSYGNHHTLQNRNLLQVNDVEKDTGSVRNVCSVKHQRGVTPVTLQIQNIYHDTNDYVHVQLSTATTGVVNILNQLESGKTSFTVEGCAATIYNRSWTYAHTINGDVRTTEQCSAASWYEGTTPGYFRSSYIKAQEVVSISTPSIAKYGYRPVGIYEASNSNINSNTEALALANAVISDLAEPTENIRVTIPFAPWFDLDASVGLVADARRRWSTDLDVTVTGLEHKFEGGVGSTELRLRKANPTNGSSWVQRIGIDADKPAVPGNFKGIPEWSLVSNITTPRGRLLGGRTFPQFISDQGERQGRRLYTEMHVGDTPTFAPDDSTLVSVGLGTDVTSNYDTQGRHVSPKTTYYVRYRLRDVLGNPAEFITDTTPATSVVVRCNDQPVTVFAVAATTTKYFNKGGWSPFPFTAISDPFNCFTSHGSALTVPFCGGGTSAATGSYFQFPRDGTATVRARIGVWNDYASGGKTDTAVAFGIIYQSNILVRLGNASMPMVAKIGGPTETTPTWSPATKLFVGTTISSLFVHLNASVWGSSGSWLQIGINPDWDVTGSGNSGIRPCVVASGNWLSRASVSWVHIAFVED